MSQAETFTLAELCIAACAEAWHGADELLASGIGPIPRIPVGLAKLTFAPQIVLTDGEAYLVEDPVPLGPREVEPNHSGWMPYGRVFDCVWAGRRHAMVTPVQMDRFAQGNIAALGDDPNKPRVQLLGVRGFPGNSINHRNSMFIPRHAPRTFVPGEVDVVSSVGFGARNWPDGVAPIRPDIGIVVTDLCVMDYRGPGDGARVVSLHPGVEFGQVEEATGFALGKAADMGTTPGPTAEQLEIIRALDPHDIRATVLKGNPPGVRE